MMLHSVAGTWEKGTYHLETTAAVHSVHGSRKLARCTSPTRSVSGSALACQAPRSLNRTLPIMNRPGGSPVMNSAAIQGPNIKYTLYGTCARKEHSPGHSQA